MKGLGKKIVALAAVAALTMTSLVGCAGSVDDNEVVATVGESEITAGVANFYLRYQQSSIEEYYGSYFGDDLWTMEISDGVSYADSVKESVMTALQQLYILKNNMDEYDVTITEEEMAEIEAAAAAFDEANTSEDKELVSGDVEIVKEVLELLTISEKMYAAIIADADTEVSDEEAAQKKMQYISFSKTKTLEDGTTEDMTEDEIADLKKEAEDFLKEAKSSGSLEAYATAIEKSSSSLTFDAESTSLSEEVITAADALKEGEFSEVIETDSAFYVVELTSLFDEEATETEKTNIVTERQNELYESVCDAWKEKTEITVNEDVYDKLSVEGLKVTIKSIEEETTDDTAEE